MWDVCFFGAKMADEGSAMYDIRYETFDVFAPARTLGGVGFSLKSGGVFSQYAYYCVFWTYFFCIWVLAGYT